MNRIQIRSLPARLHKSKNEPTTSPSPASHSTIPEPSTTAASPSQKTGLGLNGTNRERDLNGEALRETGTTSRPTSYGTPTFDLSGPTADLLDYSLFIPQHYERGYTYPLLVWLHSECGDKRQLWQTIPQISARNYAAVAIQAPAMRQLDPGAPVDPEPTDYDLADSADSADSGPLSANDAMTSRCWGTEPACLEQTAAKIQVAIDHAKLRLNIDPGRVFILGQGEGGEMAFRMAFAFPEWFAGVLSLNGRVPESFSPLSNWQRCRSVPLFWAHARRSDQFSESLLCRQLELLHIAGFSVTLRQYPCDDRLDNRVYCDADQWIMETIASLSHTASIVR